MPLQFSNDFCAACEPIARIGHKGNDPIGRHPIAIIVVNVDLPEIQHHQLASFRKHYTHTLSFIECVVASYKVVGTHKKVCSAHVEIPRWRGSDEGRKERKAPGGQKTPNYAACWSIFIV